VVVFDYIIDCFDSEYPAYYLPNTVLENLYVPDYLYALIIALGFVISILAFMPPNPELQDNMDG